MRLRPLGGGLEIKAGENVVLSRVLGLCFGASPSLQHDNALSSHLLSSYSSPHSTVSPDWSDSRILWPQFPCTSHREQGGRNCGLASKPSHPQPSSSLHLLGEGRTQRPDLSTSPTLLPLAPLSPSLPGLAEAKENRALPQLSHSLSLTSCSGKMVYSLLPPWLRTWPKYQVSSELPELEALLGLKLDPSPLSISPFRCLFFVDPSPVPLSPYGNILLFGW